MEGINVVFELGGVWFAYRALRGGTVEHVIGFSALWAIEAVWYYLSVQDPASAGVAMVRSGLCAAVWVRSQVWS